VIITHWKDVCLLKFPDAAFQEKVNEFLFQYFLH
jgi:hypothetical protein